LKKVSLIVLSAGSSTRFDYKVKKQWLRVDDKPLWQYVVDRLKSFYSFDKVIVTSEINELSYMKKFDDQIEFVVGGATRQESILNAIESVDTEYVMITDVARSCVPMQSIVTMMDSIGNADIVVPYLDVSDTVVYQEDTIDRDNTKLIQTPQLSNVSILKKALNTDIVYTDDSSAIKAIGGKILYIKGDKLSHKLTFKNDLEHIKCLLPPSKNIFSGIGFDIHQFEDAKDMYLGGVKIDNTYGFKAHSDGDVVIHSVIDAILGAIGGGDIGEFFPDNDAQYKNIDSKKLLDYIVDFVNKVGYDIVNIDLTIIAQKPKINQYKSQIQKSLANIINIPQRFINIKATTAEKMGFIGREEGVAVQSIANLKFNDWTII
jgi:2-C-methyl-D-erythritol 4-phosphate cytidylyltransferase / 2-C-methyl-D-erythritol 2,4-cyclodiphosphate synthase